MYEALIDQIREALGQHGRPMDVRAIPSLVAPMHPSDIAAILDELTLPEAERVFALLDDERAADRTGSSGCRERAAPTPFVPGTSR